MAVVSKEKLFLKDKTEFIKVVKYSKGIFSIDLPEQICRDLCLPEKEHFVSAFTEREANDLFDAKMKEWSTAETTIRKVIWFEARFQGALATAGYQGRAQGGKYTPSYERSGYSNDSEMFEFCKSDMGRMDNTSLGLSITWAVYEKKTFKDNSDYKYMSGRPFDRFGSRGKPAHGITEIEYTEEREAFFLQLDESFARMIAKIHSALGNLTPEKLTTLAESSILLLG